jgi:DNA-3-methyladenine glycosylase I
MLREINLGTTRFKALPAMVSMARIAIGNLYGLRSCGRPGDGGGLGRVFATGLRMGFRQRDLDCWLHRLPIGVQVTILPHRAADLQIGYLSGLGLLARREILRAMAQPRVDKSTDIQRCAWAGDQLSIVYHDTEWGVPLHDDRALFELLILEGAQAGLSWITILKKRAAYRAAFDRFDVRKVARYDEARIAALLANDGIVRNRLKIRAAVQNAQAFLAVQKEFGSFDGYVWRFAGGRPLQNRWRRPDQVPARTEQSDAMSKDLAKRGFKFAGSTICYAFMQATGMVNDHLVGCYRYKDLSSSQFTTLAAENKPSVRRGR